VLGLDILRLVVARITDGHTRRMLRASSAGLRSLVNSTTTKLVFKGTRNATAAMQHVAERCEQWPNLECVVLVRPGQQCASALVQLLGSLGRCAAGVCRQSWPLPRQNCAAAAMLADETPPPPPGQPSSLVAHTYQTPVHRRTRARASGTVLGSSGCQPRGSHRQSSWQWPPSWLPSRLPAA
jgi:hypothetical protein